MNVNIGKNTLGDSDKLSVSLKEYGRSTHNLSSAWRSPMGVGTLVPFMKILGLPGDTFQINLDTQIMTHPTIGPLFGNFKFQADVFTCPIRLYNAMLHNNTLNIGLDMSKVKFPKAEFFVKNKGDKEGKASIAEYLGVKAEPWYSESEIQEYNIIPFLAYYDIFKNYYANKQEERFYVMGGSIIQNATTIETETFKGVIDIDYNGLRCTSAAKITFTGTDVDLKNIKKIKFTVDSLDVYMQMPEANLYTIETNEANKKVIKLIEGYRYVFSRAFQGLMGDEVTLQGATENIAQGIVTEAYTSSFPLTEIDDLREYILSKGREKIVVGRTSDEKLKSNFIYRVLFSENFSEPNKDKRIYPIINMEMGGLCLKTYQSDLFNNWVNKDWVDGDNGINAVTDVDVSQGKLNLDALNLAQKVYNMLNRIAISGGSYKDWIETVYSTD